MSSLFYHVVMFFVIPFGVLAAKLPVAPQIQIIIGFTAIALVLRIRNRKAMWVLFGFLLAGNLWALLEG